VNWKGIAATLRNVMLAKDLDLRCMGFGHNMPMVVGQNFAGHLIVHHLVQ
jgi:hypothetical protein